MDLRIILDREVDAWSVEDRIRLIEAVWDGLDESPDSIRLSPAQEHDLQKRIEANLANPKAISPWEEVKARLKTSSFSICVRQDLTFRHQARIEACFRRRAPVYRAALFRSTH